MSHFPHRARVRLFVVFLFASLMTAGAANQPLVGMGAQDAGPSLVISQVYGGGGNSGATLKNDFIELFNAGSTAVNVSGWSVQYASSTGTTWQVTALTNVSIQPGQYYLVQQAQGAGGTVNLPAPDATGTIPMSATNGKVALVNVTTALSGACPASAAIVDLIGFGSANCSETAPAPVLSNTTAALRAGNGCTDTDNNSADFATGAPTPRNTASPLNACSAETSPTGTGTADPASVTVGGTTLLTVAVTPGSNPASSGITVTADLSDIEGSASQAFFDDGSMGDVTAGDNTFSYAATVGAGSSPGALSLPVSIADAEGRSGATTISLTVNAVTTSPSGVGAANPASLLAGESTLLTVAVTPGTGPLSTGIAVTADLTPIGGLLGQAFYDNGTNGDVTPADNIFSFSATVAAGTPAGAKSLPVGIADAQARTGSTSIALTVQSPDPPKLVISQVYGGGGNTGSTYRNDFIEIFNAGMAPVSVGGWSVQYASSTGSSWQVTLLSGSVLPGRYYLVQQAQGAGGTVNLPAPDAIGTIPMAAASGKVALVNTTTALTGACPSSAAIMDLVGYGTANCSETSPTPALSATTAAIRNGNGSVDTNNNLADFTIGAPYPRSSTGRPPTGVGTATPASLSAGESTLLTVKVTPGELPASFGLSVTGDLTAIGGVAAQAFFDDGTHGDAVGGDNTFSFQAAVPAAATLGSKSLPFVVADAQSRSTSGAISLIVEPAVVEIHDVQGAGLASPLAGQLVATRGIVTGLKYNGFFIQTPDADTDADPSTSQGIFVFTSVAPSVTTGTLVKVAGTVTEFIPSGEPASVSTTEIGNTPSITVLESGQALPAAYVLTAAELSPLSFAVLERLEGMRVHVAALRVIAPTQASTTDEVNATSTSNGVFYGIVDGMVRPFREAGIPMLDPMPAGAPCCVPRFDENPERLRVDSDGLGGLPIEVTSGALVSNLVGPMEFAFRTWTILPDPSAPPLVSNLVSAVPVPEPAGSEFTVGSYNMERFFDTVDDPLIGEPVLTPAAFANRLNKASMGIRNVMRLPDIVGVEEVENLSTLASLASKISADAVAAGQPDPIYVAYLMEGNDVGGIDVGFLVKSARVAVIDVMQEGKDATYIDPNTGTLALLNDRPPLVLRATVQGALGSPVPVTVIVNHLRSLSGVETDARVRAKRAAQAEFLANLIQSRQAADSTERIISVGDYNAFAVNDGYVDLIGTIRGQPTLADQVVVASPDLVDPDLTSLVDLLSVDDAYSYLFDGNIQTLDHVLASAAMMKRFTRFHYARNNADFPESYRNDPNRPERLSDHDMPVAYFSLVDAPVLSARAAGRQVQLNWTNANAAGYALYRGEVDGGPYVRIAQVPGTQFLFIDRALTVGATYYWVVRPLGAGMEEAAQSNQVKARIVGR